MELTIYQSFSFAYLLFANLKMSGLSITHSACWHPPSPGIISPQPYTQNLHSVPSHPTEGLPIMKLQRCQNHISKRKWGFFSKKMLKIIEEEKSHSPERVAKYGVQIKRPNSLPSVSSSPSFPLNISSSIRTEFG